MLTRRDFLDSMAFAAAAPFVRLAGDGPRMCLAYTSFAVRMLQGKDILKSNAAALTADRFLDLCVAFGARGAQLDWSQIESHEPAALARLKARVEHDGLALELSVPASCLETPAAYKEMATTASALGVKRVRIALLYGRRYETFKTRDEWTAWRAKWFAALPAMKNTIEAHAILVGIENHKDFHATELAELLQRIGSTQVGCCVDFGNNISLLEDPIDTIRTLAPYTVTTHLKDMAVKPTAEGFELSEVALGEGLLPLQAMIDELKRHRPDVDLCLEMITRDPLQVPYKTDRYWVAMDRSAVDVARFEREILGKASTRDLPHITGLAPADQVALEDELVRRSMEYARRSLRL
jgi:3-oxoisoapionate decarboxylase